MINRSDIMVAGGQAPRKNLSPHVRAQVILGALSYTQIGDTVSLARLMSTSTRTIKRVCKLLEDEHLVKGERHGSSPTVWRIIDQHIDDSERHYLKTMFIAWLAVSHVGAVYTMDVWSRFVSRSSYYAKSGEYPSPHIATVIADETKAFAREREQALGDFFKQLEMIRNG